MIERSAVDQGKSVIDRNVVLPTQLDKRVRDNIDIANAALNPKLLIEESKIQSPDIPIWESSRSELYASSPRLKRFVVWKYDPGEKGVTKFNSFDALDPLPHHYYKSKEEYENARSIYVSGGVPDKLIDLNVYEWDIKNVSKSSEIAVFPDVKKQGVQGKSKAA